MAVIKNWSIRTVARVLIIAYALFLLKPVMPILLDGLAHTFYKSVHIAVVHRVHGKEHVHYELRKAAAESEKEGLGQKRKLVVEDEVGALSGALMIATPTALYALSAKAQSCYLYGRYSTDMSRDYPPPKQVRSCTC